MRRHGNELKVFAPCRYFNIYGRLLLKNPHHSRLLVLLKLLQVVEMDSNEIFVKIKP